MPLLIYPRMKPTTLFLALLITLNATVTVPAFGQNKKRAQQPNRVYSLETPESLTPALRATSVNALAAAHKIDQLVADKLTEQKIPANAMTTDEVFVRRIYLDVIGRVPTKAEALTFIESKAPDKRTKLIDRLINSDGYVQNMFNFWADVLRVKNQLAPGGQGSSTGAAYIQWLKQSLRENKPYDQMVRELLTADGASYENGAIGFYMRDFNMPLDNMAVTTQVFLGTQMVCAQCHDHPFDKWTQMDYYQMAAHSYGMTGTNGLAGQTNLVRNMQKAGIQGAERRELTRAMSDILFRLRFNRVQALDRQLKLPHDYAYQDGKPNDVIAPVIPAAFSKDGKIVEEGRAPVLDYAQWMTSRENPRFTLVIANRLWKKVMGMGVIDPVDELTDSTVPSNPALMAFLEQTMKDVNYDMKAYLKVLLNTRTYQHETYTQDVDPGEPYYFQGPLLRRMSAEQIWDSMVAMLKDNPDEASHSTYTDTQLALTRIEWMDRVVAVQTPEEMIEGARVIANYQKELSAGVRDQLANLKQLQEAGDEAAIKAIQRNNQGQRQKIFLKVDEVVFNRGFQKITETLAREGVQSLAKQTDERFAEQVVQVTRELGKTPSIDEALDLVMKNQKESLSRIREVAREREQHEWQVKSKQERNAYKKFTEFRERYVMRAADLRNPAPNGHFLRLYGQSDRELVNNANHEGSVMQALTMMNGNLLRNLLSSYSTLSRVMKEDKTPDEVIDTIYLSTLTRRATEEEKNMLRPVITENTQRGRGDVLWAVLNTRQFLFIQ